MEPITLFQSLLIPSSIFSILGSSPGTATKRVHAASTCSVLLHYCATYCIPIASRRLFTDGQPASITHLL